MFSLVVVHAMRKLPHYFQAHTVIVLLNSLCSPCSKRLIIHGFSATNNEAEYKALLIRIAIVQKMGGKVVEVF